MQAHDSERRTLLRGAILGGCALCIPALWGCDRDKPPGTAEKAQTGAGTGEGAPGAAPGAPSKATPGGAAGSAPGGGKVSQAQVQYQTQPKGNQKCAACMHFVAADGSCKLVEGPITPEGWCTLFAPKTT